MRACRREVLAHNKHILFSGERSKVNIMTISSVLFGGGGGFYHAGVLRFSFGCMSSPAYLSELYEYLYVGGK